MKASIVAVLMLLVWIRQEVLAALPSREISLSQVLEILRQDAEEMKALSLSLQSLELEIRSRDLALAPQVTAQLAEFWDNRKIMASNALVNANVKARSQTLDLSLIKSFSTGTQLRVSTGLEDAELRTFPDGDRRLAKWEIGISQSLWQDFFGRATELRRSGDRFEKLGRYYGLQFQMQSYVVLIEGLYWDWLSTLKEIEIRQENLARSRKIESWVRARFAKSAAESTDVLQAQALVASRDLQLISVQDRLQTAYVTFRQALPEAINWTDLRPEMASLERPRAMLGLLAFEGSKDSSANVPFRLDALSARYNSQSAEKRAEQVAEGLKPSLSVFATHGRNGIDFTSRWAATQQAVGSNNNYTQVGIVVSTPLDFDLINQQKESAYMNAEAQRLRAGRLSREGQIQWNDLSRQVQVLNDKVNASARLADFQKRKAVAEAHRYSLGRTTAFQVITFEQDAAEAELQVVQMQAQLRKLESQARFFTYEEKQTP